ncbi:asparagine synthase (glutamine-hydrolyzing) [Bordetella genomosp. 12]|uniref:asparagine synthase (glutamine-hydrolyzing) n=1 Tax=Bordetella genomosp. 12 TaxID=463035 RepID=A0A261VGA0_9BORD|nr:asparagine synthase (glutamine-hydrolyzing) [Bordetella genomosp. 12]OZI72183.1 asparagine synthase (glutamine-hydrolyzing) [Bordetella genomosp. 12]
MCGILGGWWLDRSTPRDVSLAGGLACLKHRGPDDQGHIACPVHRGHLSLGHTRLSIIDLSHAGHQPMVRGPLTLVYNGEIYNYRELRQTLRAQGHAFDSDSDTEVLLAAWQQWGPAALRRLTGMFAFAVYDARDGSLTLARDAFGIKPLYYSADDQRLVFGSELTAVRALDPSLKRLDHDRAIDYLVRGRYDNGAGSFIHDLRQLEPAHLLRYEPGAPAIAQRWWQAPVAERYTGSFENAAAEFRDRFLDSVRLHLRSDVPIGAALSGGLDSSAIVCAMRHVEPALPIHTFSYIAEGAQSEERWVDVVNSHCGAIAHKITLSAPELARDLDALILAQNEPFGSTSIYAQYRIFQHARQSGIVVALEGQGGDELLAGYGGYPVERLASLLGSGQPRRALQYARRLGNHGQRGLRLLAQACLLAFAPDRYHALKQRSHAQLDWLNLAGRPLAPQRRPAAPRGRQVMGALAGALQGDGLPALLRHGDRNAMHFSLESRVPFLTCDLAEFLLGLPEDYLLSSRADTKHLLRAALKGIVPQAVLERKDKIGFATPEQAWMRALAPQLRQWLQAGPQVPFIRREKMLAHFDAMMEGRSAFSWQAWRWVNFSRWMTLNAVDA